MPTSKKAPTKRKKAPKPAEKPDNVPAGFKSAEEYADHVAKQRKIAEQNAREAAIERNEKLRAAEAGELAAAYEPGLDVKEKELQTDWEYLQSYAKTHFPEGADHFRLTARERLIGIASCLGWSQPKIGKACSITGTRVGQILKKPHVKLFMDEFNFKRGAEGYDPLQKLDAIVNSGLNFAESVMRDKDPSDACKRLKFEVTKWAMERKYGKSSQPIEHKGDAIKAMVHQLSSVKFDLTDEDEEEVFSVQ